VREGGREEGARTGRKEGGRGGADTELKTKTPHVNVGNYIFSQGRWGKINGEIGMYSWKSPITGGFFIRTRSTNDFPASHVGLLEGKHGKHWIYPEK